MAERLPLAPERVDEVATTALVCRQTVQRYRDGLRMLLSTEYLITKAIRELPESPQLEIKISVAGAGDDPAGSPGVSGEPKDPQERTPAEISSEVAAKACCQPSVQTARSGCGVCPAKGARMIRTWPWLLFLVALFLAASGELRCAWGQEMSITQNMCIMPEPLELQKVQDTCAMPEPASNPLWRSVHAPGREIWVPAQQPLIIWPMSERVDLVYGHSRILVEGPDAIALGARILLVLARKLP